MFVFNLSKRVLLFYSEPSMHSDEFSNYGLDGFMKLT